jgi:transcriptional regulator with XRE-family HTH domain
VEKDVICMDAKMFGAFLAQVRRAQGLTQAELAEQLHVTDKAVSRWERGVSHS